MSTSELDRAWYAHMRWNTPLSEGHADVLLERLGNESGDSLLDLGCGWGELLIRAVAEGDESSTGIGVDIDPAALQRGRERVVKVGLEGRIEFVEGAAQDWTEPADRILCVGSAHVWGGAAAALAAIGRLIRPGGRVLFGDGCWERPPTGPAMSLFGDSVLPLRDLVQAARAAGWRVLHLSTADQREWDEFESTWRAGRQEWLLANGDAEQAQQVGSQLDAQLSDYINVYRGVLSFCYLVLGR